MPKADQDSIKWGLIAVVDGVVLWIFAILFSAYQADRVVIDSVQTFFAVIASTMGNWVASPGVTVVEAAGYLGLTIAVFGPITIWLYQHYPSKLTPAIRSAALDIDEEIAQTDRNDPVVQTDGAVPVSGQSAIHSDLTPRAPDLTGNDGTNSRSQSSPHNESGADNRPKQRADPLQAGEGFEMGMNPFRPDGDGDDAAGPDSLDEDELTEEEDQQVGREEIESVLASSGETSSVYIDVDLDESRYRDLSKAASTIESDIEPPNEPIDRLSNILEMTSNRLEELDLGEESLTMAKRQSDEIVNRISQIETGSGGVDGITEDLDTAQRELQEFRINLGSVNPSYPSFIATDIANSAERVDEIENALEDISNS